PLRLKFIPASGTATQLPIRSLQVPDPSPTRTVVAA
ncbi:MAG: segregation and condensation protein A, partial [Synechococcus sp. ARS1019]|nr:segregation and condensation protein A [Synechococcus sp. ARS1019]